MIEILDKVIYGLGALTLVGVSLLIIALTLFVLAAITMGVVDSAKKITNKSKSKKDEDNG